MGEPVAPQGFAADTDPPFSDDIGPTDLADTPMAETVTVGEQTLAEAAAEAEQGKGPLTSERIARMVEEEEKRAEEPAEDERPPDDPETEECPQCHGWGKTLTGSRVPEEASRQCPFCTGRGWVEKYRLEDWARKLEEQAQGAQPPP